MAEEEMAEEEMAEDEMAEMLGAFGPGCDAVPTEGDGSFEGMADDPAATAASANPLLSTLVSAVTQAGLVDTLNGPGPFTIFAPTNDAFAAIPAETLEMVLADTDLLTTILTYHVVGGESLDAAGLGAAGSATTVQGTDLSFGADGTTVNDVDVLCSDVPTANATVHIIGEVLLPAGPGGRAVGRHGRLRRRRDDHDEPMRVRSAPGQTVGVGCPGIVRRSDGGAPGPSSPDGGPRWW